VSGARNPGASCLQAAELDVAKWIGPIYTDNIFYADQHASGILGGCEAQIFWCMKIPGALLRVPPFLQY